MSKHADQRGFTVVEVGIVIAVVVVIGALGWKFYEAKFGGDQVSSVNERSSNIDITPDTLTDLADIEQIQQEAVGDKSGITVVHIELEQKDDGTLVYKVQLSDGTVTVYNAKTGVFVKTVMDSEKTSESLPVNFTSGISFTRALEIARGEKPDSKVYKIELEQEDGIVVYSVRFSDKARVDVNALDGAIVRVKAAKVEANELTSDSDEQHRSSNDDHKSNGDDSDSRHDAAGDDNSSSHTSGSDDDDDLSDNDDDDLDDDKDDDDDLEQDDSRSGSRS